MGNVEYASDGPIAVVTINRPAVRNAVDRDTAEELAAVFRRFDADDALRVAVLRGADGTFCAGADLKSGSSRLAEDGDGPMGVSRLLLDKPTIAAVEGYAVAGGLEVAIWCDLRVAAADAVFGVFCRRWGVPLMDGGTVRLARLIGHSHALDMILTGRQVRGEEALRMGLANRVVPTGTAFDAAMSLARDIARFPQECMRSDRLSSYEQWNMTQHDALTNEFHRGMRVIQSGSMMEGLGTFAQTAGRRGSLRHVVLGTPMLPPFPDGMESVLFAMGSTAAAERRLWQTPGVFTTAVGHSGGTEFVRVVYDPGKISFASLLRVFWEGHDPTAAVGSAIACSSAGQRREAEAAREAQQAALSAAGRGKIRTEILAAGDFEYADDAQQQYLAKNPTAA
jgi:enoyl-CoA hydratase